MIPIPNRDVKRPYLAILTLLLLIFLGVRFIYLRAPGATLNDSLLATASDVMDALIGAMLAALGVAVLILGVFPPSGRPGSSKLVKPSEINNLLEREASRTDRWYIRARTGVFFRARTVHQLAEATVKGNKPIDVQIVLVDPRDEELERKHLKFRASKSGNWDERRVALETCATILSCIATSNRYGRLTISIYLSQTLWEMSLDISRDNAILCGSRSGQAAWVHPVEGDFYDSYRSEFEATQITSIRLPVSDISDKSFDDLERISLAMHRLGLQMILRTRDDLETIRSFISDPERSNQYK